MMRRHLTFACGEATLLGTLDEAAGVTGLLLVSGGNETRAGAFSGQAQLAARLAAAGHPVFRFDRRGVGDSEGENLGFSQSAQDIAAALDAFRAQLPAMERVIGFGNCDAASALMLAEGAGLDGLVLANPWTIEDDSAPPPPKAVRARYAAKLRNPSELLRLVTGGVSFAKLARGIGQALRPAPQQTTLAQAMTAGLGRFSGPVAILLAARDRTAQAFDAAWDSSDRRIRRCPDATHAFVEPHARVWLYDALLAALAQE